MFIRNALIVIGGLGTLGGIVLLVIWFIQIGTTRSVERPAVSKPAVLVAAHPIRSGTLLRNEDIAWKEVPTAEVHVGNILRGQISEAELVGAIARRSFAAGERLIASELVKPSERQFLAAVLKPGTRAVSIAIDLPQSAAGLILPGDRVDVILTQSFDAKAADSTRKSVAETVLRDVQVIAVNQSLGKTAKAGTEPHGAFAPATASRPPNTVTFELTERQAEQLFVAAQLGRLQLSVRPLEGRNNIAPKGGRKSHPTWASDVSSALSGIARKEPSVNPVESSVRRPPIMSQ